MSKPSFIITSENPALALFNAGYAEICVSGQVALAFAPNGTLLAVAGRPDTEAAETALWLRQYAGVQVNVIDMTGTNRI